MTAHRLFRFLLAAAVVLAAGGASAGRAGQARVVNCIAAVVNDEIITRTDVEVAEAFGLADVPASAGAESRRPVILEKLIDRKLVLIQVRERSAATPPEAIEAEWKALADRLGPAGIRQRLERFGLSEADLRAILEQGVRYRLTIENRFGRSVSVTLKEIETYYNEIYTPGRAKDGAAVKPLTEVLDAIEAEIKRTKIAAEAALWLETLRDQAEVEIRPDCLK